MIHRFSVLLACLAVFAVLVLPVAARVVFCRSDPIFDVGGHEVKVVVGLAPPEVKKEISKANPVRVVLRAPKGTDPQVKKVKGAFPQVAVAEEHSHGEQFVSVTVQVPDVPSFYALRVDVYEDGQLVRSQQTSRRWLAVRWHWAHD